MIEEKYNIKHERKYNILVLFVTFIVFFSLSFCYAQYLYKIDNNCTDTRWVNNTHHMVLNGTLNAWQLNITESNVYEDFTTFTEMDAYNELSIINSTEIQFVDWGRNAPAQPNGIGIYYDYGADKFTSTFEIWIDVYIDDYVDTASSARSAIITLADTPYCRAELTDGWLVYIQDGGTNQWEIRLTERHNSASSTGIASDWDLAEDTWYYFIFSGDGTSIYGKVYDDSGRTSLIGSSSLVLNDNADSFSTLSLLNNYANTGGDDDTDTIIGYLKYLDIDISIDTETESYLYTNDLLENTTRKAFIYGTSQQIFSNNNITVAFSDNNITWLRENILSSIHESNKTLIYLEDLNLSKLYVKYYLHSNGDYAPYITNMTVIYPDAVTGGNNNQWWLGGIFIFIPIILVMIVIMGKKR